MSNAIEVRGVTRSFRKTTALNNVSFEVPEGSICGLLGRNGAGKTTLMALISGQDKPTSGEVLVNGHAPFENANTLTQISYIRDNQRYPDDYKLKHILRIAPAFAPRWNATLAQELVDGFRIPEKTAIKKLSRGQLSSVAIVLGLASQAPITLFDEPYLGLDVAARHFFYDILIREIAETPRTILFSTHLIEEAESLFDHVALIEAGEIVLAGDPDDVRAGAYVASGIGAGIDSFLASRLVLSSQAVGVMKSAIVGEPLSAAAEEDARRQGVQLTAATLQDLVVAYGSPGGPGRANGDSATVNAVSASQAQAASTQNRSDNTEGVTA